MIFILFLLITLEEEEVRPCKRRRKEGQLTTTERNDSDLELKKPRREIKESNGRRALKSSLKQLHENSSYVEQQFKGVMKMRKKQLRKSLWQLFQRKHSCTWRVNWRREMSLQLFKLSELGRRSQLLHFSTCLQGPLIIEMQ